MSTRRIILRHIRFGHRVREAGDVRWWRYVAVSYEMQTVASALVTCLGRQADELRNLLELHAFKRDAARGHDTREPERLAAALQRTVTASAGLESERQDLTKRLIELGAGTPISLDFTDVTRLIEVSQTSRLAQLHEQLCRLWEDVEHRRSINSALVERSTRAARDTLRWIARTIPARAEAANPAPRRQGVSGDRTPT